LFWIEGRCVCCAEQVAAQSLLESIAGAFSFLLNPIAGCLSDCFGRKRVRPLSATLSPLLPPAPPSDDGLVTV
jgi:hypothetical protein